MDGLSVYAAGLFDGEGYVAIRKKPAQTASTASPLPRYRLECYVKMVDVEPLRLLRDRWGGSLTLVKRANPKWRDTYQWHIQALKARTFLIDLLPYLVVKKPQAKLGIAFQDHLVEFGALRYCGQGLKRLPLDDAVRIRDSFCFQMHELNMRGVKVQD